MTIHGAHRRVLVALLALAAGLGIAACGSSSNSSSTSNSASVSGGTSTNANFAARRTALVACLKAHGVTLPNGGRFGPGAGGPPPGGGTGTNPTPGAGRFLFGGGGGGGAARFANNPKLAAAFQACGGRVGGGRFRGGAGLGRTRITQFVACVRKNGFNLPTPNFSGNGPVFPANLRTNAKFLAASQACASILTAPRPGGTSTTPAA